VATGRCADFLVKHFKVEKTELSEIPNDAPFEKDYIAGRYGAIPFIGGLHYLDYE